MKTTPGSTSTTSPASFAFDSTCNRHCSSTGDNVARGCLAGRPQVYRKDRSNGNVMGISIVNGAGSGAPPTGRTVEVRGADFF